MSDFFLKKSMFNSQGKLLIVLYYRRYLQVLLVWWSLIYYSVMFSSRNTFLFLPGPYQFFFYIFSVVEITSSLSPLESYCRIPLWDPPLLTSIPHCDSGWGPKRSLLVFTQVLSSLLFHIATHLGYLCLFSVTGTFAFLIAMIAYE